MSFRYRMRGAKAAIITLILAATAVNAQEAPTPTPLLISLPTATPDQPFQQEQQLVAETSTWTPTAPALAVLEALDIANVRSLPDTAESQLGTIRAGEFYNVIGRYINWYQLQYDSAPQGFGWVYGELVTITGDPSVIPEVDPYGGQTSGLDIETTGGIQEGGVIATATIQTGSTILEGGATVTPAPLLPTFTFPAGLVHPQATNPAPGSTQTPIRATTSTGSDNVPPIIPILVLGGIGLLGLAVTSLRR